MYTRWGRAFNHTTTDFEPPDDDDPHIGIALTGNGVDPDERVFDRNAYTDSYADYAHPDYGGGYSEHTHTHTHTHTHAHGRTNVFSPTNTRALSSGDGAAFLGMDDQAQGGWDFVATGSGEPSIEELEGLLKEVTNPGYKKEEKRNAFVRDGPSGCGMSDPFEAQYQDVDPSKSVKEEASFGGSGNLMGIVTYASLGKPPTPQYGRGSGSIGTDTAPGGGVVAHTALTGYPVPPSPPVAARPTSPGQQKMVPAWNTSRPSSSSSSFHTRLIVGHANFPISLSDDVLAYILSWLWPVRELFSSRLACHGFKLLTDSLRLDCNICFQSSSWKETLVCDACYESCCRSCAGLGKMPKAFPEKSTSNKRFRAERYKHLPLVVRPRPLVKPRPWVSHPCGHSMNHRRTCPKCTLACSRCRAAACDNCIWCDGSRKTCYSCTVTYGR